MPTRTEWLAEQPFTLMLSAGFFGFFSHTGLLTALEERKIVPRKVIGVSAGALAGGLWAAGVPASEIAATLHELRRTDFWDPGLPLGGLLRGKKFSAKLQETLAPTGITSVEQTRVTFRPVVHDVFSRKPVAVAEGPMHVAIRASCTVPLMFRPVLHNKRVLVDGGVSDRCGFTALESDERVLLHFLPSRRRFGPPQSRPQTVPVADSETLLTPGLPRVTPFRLDQGPVAYRTTLAYARAWLDEER